MNNKNEKWIKLTIKVINIVFLCLISVFFIILILAVFIDDLDLDEGFLIFLIACTFILLSACVISFYFILVYYIYPITKKQQDFNNFFIKDDEKNFEILKAWIESLQIEEDKNQKSSNEDIINKNMKINSNLNTNKIDDDFANDDFKNKEKTTDNFNKKLKK